jgi:hypothetical protein
MKCTLLVHVHMKASREAEPAKATESTAKWIASSRLKVWIHALVAV